MSHAIAKSRTGKESGTGVDDLQFELTALQSAIKAAEQKGLQSPIMNDRDFVTRLGQIKRAYKQTRFDGYLQAATRHLYDYLKRIQPKETYEYWKARTLLYELDDIFNIEPEIKEHAAYDGRRILEELRNRSARWNLTPVPRREELKILREKVLLCVCRGNELKRNGETTAALDLFEWLLEFTTKRLQIKTFPCYSTRATLCYHIGSALRTLEQHRRAEARYSEALDLLYARGKKLGPSDYLCVARKQAMVVGLGFGLINMTRGFLDRAEHALSTARSMLASVEDPSASSYVELLYNTILRCRAGSDRERLEEVVKRLDDTRKTFSNPRYQARSCWELALAKTLLGDLDGAQRDLDQVSNYADQANNRKWQVNVQILKSRIAQRHEFFDEALEFAEEAVKLADSPDCWSILPLVDAYITRGETYLALATANKLEVQYTRARENFESALNCTLERRSSAAKQDYLSNPKISGVCLLRIAQCHVRTGKQEPAKKYYASWLRLAPHVEHEWVRELAETVRKEIEKISMDFTISAAAYDNWNYSKSVEKLRRWLLTQSLRRTNHNYSEAAKLIGVQRTTLYQWQAQVETTKRRRARTAE